MGVSKEEIKKVIGLINESEEAKELLAGWEKVIQFDLEGEENPFHIVFTGEAAEFKDEPHPSPDLTFKADTELFAKILRGEEDATSAFMMGKLTIDGIISDALKFREIVQAARGG
jgi:putative sterol carrier protein